MRKLLEKLGFHRAWRVVDWSPGRGRIQLRTERDMKLWHWGWEYTPGSTCRWSLSVHTPWVQLGMYGPFSLGSKDDRTQS